MKTLTFELPEEAVVQVERAGYEYEARKSVIADMLSMNMDTDTDAFARYQNEMIRYKVEFEAAKSIIQTTYVDAIPNAKKWNLEYDSRILTVTVDE